MATTASPYGLYVRKVAGARRNTAGNTHYVIPANVAGAMYYGAPVTFVVGGSVGPVAASPTSLANKVVGVVQGAQWISVTKPEWFPSLPAGTYAAGGRKIEVMVNDDPDVVMMVQATGAVDYTKIGFVGALLNVSTGNNSSGRSVCSLDHTSLLDATGDKAVRVIGIVTPGHPFPDVLVQWSTNVHAYSAMTLGEMTARDAVDPETQNREFTELVRERIDQARIDQGLPTMDDVRRPGESDRQYADRMEATKEEREERTKWFEHEREERERRYAETDEQFRERQEKLTKEREERNKRLSAKQLPAKDRNNRQVTPVGAGNRRKEGE